MAYQRHHRYRELFKYASSSIWWMFLPNPRGGRAIRESTGEHDDVAAHKVYLRRVRRDPVDRNERSLHEALLARLEWLRANRKTEDPTRKKLSEDTIEFYKKKSGTLVRLLGAETLLSEIGAERIREYIIERTEEGAAGTTIDKELTTLSMAMKLAKQDGVACEFVKPADFKSTYVPRERWLTREEYDRFAAYWMKHRQLGKLGILDFIVSTGATYPSEVHRSSADGIRVHIRGTKRALRDRKFDVPSDRRDLFKRAVKQMPFPSWGNIRRDILIVCAYLSMCSECEATKNLWWRDGDDWVQGTHQVMGTPSRSPHCEACKRKTQFEPFCPTDLRRSFAQWLVRAGVPYELARLYMGHVDDRMLRTVYGKQNAVDVGPLVEAAMKRAGGSRVGDKRKKAG